MYNYIYVYAARILLRIYTDILYTSHYQVHTCTMLLTVRFRGDPCAVGGDIEKVGEIFDGVGGVVEELMV